MHLDPSYMGLPPAGNATTWTKPVSARASLLPVSLSLRSPPRGLERDRRRRRRRPTDREDHLGVRLLRPVPCCCAAAFPLPDLESNRPYAPSIFLFFWGASSNPQHVGAAVLALAFFYAISSRGPCMQCARGRCTFICSRSRRPRRRVVLYRRWGFCTARAFASPRSPAWNSWMSL